MRQETQANPTEPGPGAELEALRRQRDELRERQQATFEILRAIADTSGGAEQLLRRIAEITGRLFDASSVSLLIAAGERWGLTRRWAR